jgi:hypothetical protein
MDFPEGNEVVVTPGRMDSEDDRVTPAEVARGLAAMQKLDPLEIPGDVGSDLDAWERKINQHGIDNRDVGIEDVFR